MLCRIGGGNCRVPGRELTGEREREREDKTLRVSWSHLSPATPHLWESLLCSQVSGCFCRGGSVSISSFVSFTSFSFASFLDRLRKWCSGEIINRMGGAWRAEKAIRTKATWEFVEIWGGV